MSNILNMMDWFCIGCGRPVDAYRRRFVFWRSEWRTRDGAVKCPNGRKHQVF